MPELVVQNNYCHSAVVLSKLDGHYVERIPLYLKLPSSLSNPFILLKLHV